MDSSEGSACAATHACRSRRDWSLAYKTASERQTQSDPEKQNARECERRPLEALSQRRGQSTEDETGAVAQRRSLAGLAFFRAVKNEIRIEIRSCRRDPTDRNDCGRPERPRSERTYGRGRWRKRKGVADVRLPNGNLRRVELHWYEAHGLGKRDTKIKRYLDRS